MPGRNPVVVGGTASPVRSPRTVPPTSPDALAATAPAEPNERGPSFFYEVPVRLGGFVIPPEEALVVRARELIVPQRLGDARLFEVGDRLDDRVGLPRLP